MISNYRPPVDRFIWEFPAGLIDPNEDPEVAAIREFKEETGYKVTKMLSQFPSRAIWLDPALTDEKVLIYFGECDMENEENINPKQNLELGEMISVH